ncbi:MAG: CBM9 family sugar-binding protein [Nonlabens sp.]|nr:CBM9 family sugar-binding protein [Nonlabens sp.]
MKKIVGLVDLKWMLWFALCGFASCHTAKTNNPKTGIFCTDHDADGVVIEQADGAFVAQKTSTPIIIDGCGTDAIWSTVPWYSMNYVWMGNQPTTADYHGKFKLAWDAQFLYILVAVQDDILHPTLADGMENYWKGDYVEVFLDEDQSGGDHKENHQAFAYHVTTDGHAIDLNTQGKATFFDSHVNVRRSQEGDLHLWELAISLHDKQFDENKITNKPVTITAQKRIGFSIAYGDNDGNKTRENFMGSKKTHGVNNDEGYVNASVFGSLLFVE